MRETGIGIAGGNAKRQRPFLPGGNRLRPESMDKSIKQKGRRRVHRPLGQSMVPMDEQQQS
ncbi:hypothetical protein DSCW_31730 [Desulfosarcina widdelii]|uniref:Uncharacterized protein n=1 Tax=Desulfosarcina widdelii TaxID=947919 RepID=A0A5K7Z245_9BACT|nr:hypothetical protein DSCW_31730 [Desulfosarcina widdelii]